jgi:DNA helicase II / ATP-dependent DNA helicase PcrA
MSRSITCGHCGGSHASVAEVRTCSAAHPAETGPEPAFAAEPELPLEAPVPARAARPRAAPLARAVDEGPAPTADAAVLAGPAALGRSVLVRPGQAAPPPWAEAARVIATDDPAVLARLHAAWSGREPLVIELAGELPHPATTWSGHFWELTPRTELPGERLHFLLTANTVDARDPQGASFWPLTAAVALGARVEGPAEVVVPGGTAAWVDGGPLEPLGPHDLDGHPMVPRVHLVCGRLAPLPTAGSTTADLAEDQLRAVTHTRGPARIIAPAGSGKTRVLTERTRHLVRDRGVVPAAVSLVAYNRRARLEMAQRLGDVAGLDIRTLNSLALAIAGGTGAFQRPGTGPRLTTVDEREARRILERLVPGRRRRALTDPLEPWVDALSACRLGLRAPDDIEAEYADVTGFADVLEQYRTHLRERNLLDFDEQVLTAIEVLLTDAEARRIARAAAPVLLVDEFQDLTPAHLLLVRLLAGPAGEVFAVGDDDQTIYGYTGASPEWLVDFDHFFPGAHDHPLTVNYRCPPAVVDAAVNLLSHNRHRVAKDIHAAPDREPLDGELRVERPPDPDRALVAHVQHLLTSGALPGEIAVLARVNAALLPPLLFLAQAGVPVRRPPGVDVHLLERSGTGAALAWLRLATAPERALDSADLRLALRRPPRSLHPRIADWVCEQRSVRDLLALADRVNNAKESDAIGAFAADLAVLRDAAAGGADAGALLDLVYDELGLLSAATQLDSSQRTARRAAHADELRALRAVAALHPDPAELDQWLRRALAAIPAGQDEPDVVTLATIHATKGQEWPHVVVHDVRRDLHPHHLAIDVEEERRVFHVAITRGRSSVLVLASAPRSPFLTELEEARPAQQAWPEVVASRSAPTRAGGPPTRVADGATERRTSPRHEALRAWRLKQAKAGAVPPYVVFNDATLDAIVDTDPTTLAQLGRVKGIGPAKLDRYGDEILGVLAEFR